MQLDRGASPKSKVNQNYQEEGDMVEPAGAFVLRSGDWLGNRNSKRAGPFLRLCHLHRVQPVAEYASQLGAPRFSWHRDHSFSALQTSCHPVHGCPPI
jgi:hypothetical protein